MAHAAHAAGAPSGTDGPDRSDVTADDLVETPRHGASPRAPIVLSIVIAVPVAAAVMTGLVALVVTADHVQLAGPLVMAAAVGILVGVFFGAWAGFVGTTHDFERLDARHEPGLAAGGGGATGATEV